MNFLLIAQVSSAITTLVGIVILASIFRSLWHLEKDSYRSVILSLGLFFLITLMCVASMTLYQIFDARATDEFAETMELLLYLFMFAAFIYSAYASYTAMRFGRSLHKVEQIVSKKYPAVKRKRRI